MVTILDLGVQKALRGETGEKGPAASNHGKNCEFYPKGNQYAMKVFKSGNDITVLMFLKEHSGLSERPEKVRQVWLAGCATNPGER